MSTGVPSRALWEYTDAGGCARKLPAIELATLLDDSKEAGRFMEDAAIFKSGSQLLVQTVDVITPLVPDPADFGRIAAANSLSDIYAVGAWPSHALAVAFVPRSLDLVLVKSALDAARSYLSVHGCHLVGGHSVTDSELKLGFAVTGLPNRSGRFLHSGARPGDKLLLTKPIGLGLLLSAIKGDLANRSLLDVAVEQMVACNDLLPRLLESNLEPHIHASTDVSGYGLLAHAGELARRSGVGVFITPRAVPLLPDVERLAADEISTSAFHGNARYVEAIYGVDLRELSVAERIILTDPQTSGGALLAVESGAVEAVTRQLADWGVHVHVVGAVTDVATGELRINRTK